MMRRLGWASWAGILLVTMALAPGAEAASHQWRFNELFSNADGTVQFIEMKECCGFTAEHELGGKWILAVGAENQFDFRGDLTGDTSNRHLLLATQGFADLPGAPTPDIIIPDGFLPVESETLEYWLYNQATFSYDSLPTDGVTSLNADHTTGLNSPTNYAGDSGSVTPVESVRWGSIKVMPFPRLPRRW